ncbi:MAG: sensor histidine kinase N-terminal domain-containing protein [Rhodobacteraceae bacterium]|nr:sensor histidine kinase N-terminal domain-containing protein [Paracoccaceae bacterium]
MSLSAPCAGWDIRSLPKAKALPVISGYSLKARLAAALAIVFAIGGVAVAVAALAYGRNAAQLSYDRLLIGAANQIAQSVELRKGAVVVDLPVSAFELLSLAPEDRVVYAVFDPQNRLITGYDTVAPPASPARFYNGVFTGEPIRLAQVARNFAERGFSGPVTVVVGQTTRARADLAAQITRNALIAAGLAGIAMIGLSVFAVWSALRPLARIERDLAQRSPQDLTPVDVAIPTEIGSLVAALNRFMGRLDRQIGVMRNLIADASHQLRTPIAALRAQAELAFDEPDPDRLRRIVGRIHARSLTLSRLTDQLLNHALIIHRADSEPLQPVDLRTVAIRAIDETDRSLFATDIRPGLDLPENPVWCAGDALSLAEACKNLLGNALRHGTAPVTLVVTQTGSEARLAVHDAGPGLRADQWADAGTRFARDSGVSADSAGLGLAIVHAVAVAHHGGLSFGHTDAPAGFEAAIVLPLTEAPKP